MWFNKEKPIGKRETPWADLAAAVAAEEAEAFPGEAAPPAAFLEEAAGAVPPGAALVAILRAVIILLAVSVALGDRLLQETTVRVSVLGQLSSMRRITIPAAALTMAALPEVGSPAVAVMVSWVSWWSP